MQGEASLNVKQREFYDRVVDAYSNSTPSMFYLDGPGGIGKSYVENVIITKVRSNGDIALAVASSGIAALLLEGGRTAHSRFKIPIDPDGTSFCYISKQSDLGDLIRQAKVVLWDEISMTNKFSLEAVDRSLRDLRDCDAPFGGVVLILGGDFRQIAPVKKRGSKEDIISITIKQSNLWQHIQCFRLEENMRVVEGGAIHDGDVELYGPREFPRWLLAVGNNQIPTVEDNLILCPPRMVLRSKDIKDLIRVVYGDLQGISSTDMNSFFSKRAILACRNDDVDEVNALTLSMANGADREYLSADSALDVAGGEGQNDFPQEYLNTLYGSNMSHHKLVLKIGTPIMLLRNLDATQGLCNGT